MRKRLLSALLALAMMLTMLPTAAFAANGDGKVAPEVEAYGFVWEAQQPNANLDDEGTYKAGSDWMGETMWVALKEGSTPGQNLWFEVTVGQDVWGCVAATSSKNMFAFSFLNRTTQWEQVPQGIVVGSDKEHATEYLAAKLDDKAEVTLKVYVTENEFTSDNHDVTGLTPIFNEKVAITKSEDTLVKVPADDEATPVFVAASSDTFAEKTVADVQEGTIVFGKPVAGQEANKYTVAISGVTLKQISGWEAFNQALVEEQNGYYLAFAVAKTVNGKEIKGMILEGKDAEGNKVQKKYETAEALNGAFSDAENTQCNLFIHVGANADAVKSKAPVIQLKYGDEENYTTYTLDLSQVKVEGEEPAQKTPIKSVAITMNGEIEKGAALPEVKVVTDPAEAATATVSSWKQGEQTVEAANVNKTAGTYTATFTVVAGEAHELTANTTYTVNGKTVAADAPLTAELVVKAAQPKMFAGLSMDAATAVEDIKAATGLTITTLDDEPAENLLWFFMSGLEPGKYTLSMKNSKGVEVLNENSVAYDQGDLDITVGESGKYLNYVSLDQFSADGATGQGNKTALSEGGKFTVTATKGTGSDAVVVSGEISLVTVELKAADATSAYTPVVLFAQQNGKVKIPAGAPVKTGYTFQGWNDGVKTYNADDVVTVAAANVELNALWSNDAVEAAAPEVNADAITDSAVKDSLTVSASADSLLKDKGVADFTDEIVTTQLDTDEKKDALLPAGMKTADGYTVVVQVYLEVVANEYTAPANGEPAVLKLDVTPKYKYAAKKGTDPAVEIPGQTGTALTSKEYAEPVAVTVTLAKDKGFVANEEGVYALHYTNDKVDQYIPAMVAANGADKVDISFNATKFSPYAITKDARKVTVTFKQESGNTTATYTPDKFGMDLNLPEVTVDEGKEFKGWAKETATDKILIVPTDKTLTEELLKTLMDNATDGALVLVPVIGDKSSGGSTGPAPGGIGGGSSGTTTYSVNVPTVSNGTVTVNPRNAAKDATVTITVAPNQGYHLESLTVTDKDGNTIELTKVDATKYTFKMPASRVEVKAVFAEGEAPAVSFTDVAEGEYYYDAVKWAVDKGVTNGLTETTFGPNASCTRAQMVTFLWRAAGSPEPTATTTAFTDIDANEYYYKAVLWAVEKGITTGTTETTFSPNATVTRAQTVTFLYRYAGSPAVSGSNNFTDLEAGEYYINAVQWAATNGITTGTTETTFSPANNCTRGQIVTFLYRHIVK